MIYKKLKKNINKNQIHYYNNHKYHNLLKFNNKFNKYNNSNNNNNNLNSNNNNNNNKLC